MRCEYCGEQDATVHLTQIMEGETKKLHLCMDCASKNGINVDEPVSLTDLLLKVEQAAGAGEAESGKADKSCPQCHMRLGDFKKTSRLGCPACYDAFAGELEPLLFGLHKSKSHSGKAPAGIRVDRDRLDRAEELSVRLKAAIAAERFEEAARLRDDLRRLRAETPGGESGHEQP